MCQEMLVWGAEGDTKGDVGRLEEGRGITVENRGNAGGNTAKRVRTILGDVSGFVSKGAAACLGLRGGKTAQPVVCH